MTTVEMLRGAVVADPSDLAAKYAYADACEESGLLHRAKFVRDQLWLESLYDPQLHGPWVSPTDDAPSGYKDCKLCYKLHKTFCAFHAAKHAHENESWCNEDATVEREVITGIPFVFAIKAHLSFRMGFVDYVECEAHQWMKHGKKLVRRNPVTRVKTDRQHFGFGYSCAPRFSVGDPRKNRGHLSPRIHSLYVSRINAVRVKWYELNQEQTDAIVADALSEAFLQWARE